MDGYLVFEFTLRYNEINIKAKDINWHFIRLLFIYLLLGKKVEIHHKCVDVRRPKLPFGGACAR